MKRSLLLPALGLTLLLCACPAAPGPDGTVRQLGVVEIGGDYGDEGDYEVYGAKALFSRVNRPLESLDRVTDRCFLEGILPSLEDGSTLLDAGPSIDLKVSQRPFAALGRVNFEGGGYGYTAGEFGVFPPVPGQGLTAEVPGAVFPQFQAAEFPAPPPPVAIGGVEVGEFATMTPEGRFTWTPYDPGDGVSLITFQVAPEDTEARPYAIVACIAADDGEFTFPEETKAALQALEGDYEGQVIAPDRSVYWVVPQGEAALVVSMGDRTFSHLLGE